MSTQVVNVKHTIPDFYIGREAGGTWGKWPPSFWGNPYHIPADGNREEVIARYEVYIRERLAAEPGLWDELMALEGQTLGCWCAPKPCHGDVLVRLIEERRAALSDVRHPLGAAEAIADGLVGLLRPFCERIQIAGSIRRRKPTVKDIEVVAVPRVEPRSVDLFGESTAMADLLHLHIVAMRACGEVSDRLDKHGRPAFGTKAKRLTYRGIGLDLFSVTPDSWGVQLAIRTGPAEFSHRFMTPRRFGGNLPDHMIVRDGTLYRHPEERPLPMDREERRRLRVEELEAVPTLEEDDFFDAIGMAWIAPEERT